MKTRILRITSFVKSISSFLPFFFLIYFLNSFSSSILFCQIATRRAYGVALAKLGQSSQRVVALDGDTKNSTFSETFKKAFPDRYIECFIAEQNMV